MEIIYYILTSTPAPGATFLGDNHRFDQINGNFTPIINL